MKAYVQTACLLGFAAFSTVSGLGLTDLPDCAVSRINSHCKLLEILETNLKMKKPCAENLPAQCSKVDFKCICGSTDWISGISCCVLKSCSAADQQSQCTRRIRTSFWLTQIDRDHRCCQSTMQVRPPRTTRFIIRNRRPPLSWSSLILLASQCCWY